QTRDIHSMIRSRPFLALLVFVAALATLAWLWFRGSFTSTASTPEAKAVPEGDQEIALIQTSDQEVDWQNIVSAFEKLSDRHPRFRLGKINPFPGRTAAVPEVALFVKGSSATLWIRWYKLTSDMDERAWIRALARRDPPPLAILGGQTSDRAMLVARALHDEKDWKGPAPL